MHVVHCLYCKKFYVEFADSGAAWSVWDNLKNVDFYIFGTSHGLQPRTLQTTNPANLPTVIGRVCSAFVRNNNHFINVLA